MKKTYILFAALLFTGLGVALAARSDTVVFSLHFLWSRPFHIALFAALALVACMVALGRFGIRLPGEAVRLVYGVLFLPVLFLPIVRCSFAVPFVFCRACPTRCPWGMTRAVLFSSAVFLNLFARSWCAGLCPLGSFQECEARVSGRAVSLLAWLKVLPYLTLAGAAALAALPFFYPPAVSGFMRGYYTWGSVTLSVAAAILAAAFFVPRFWCRYLCPVGTIAAITSSRRSSPRA